MKMLDWAGGLFRWACGAVVPMFARPVPPVPPAWFAHVVLVGIGLVAAYLLQNGPLRDRIDPTFAPEFFRPWWLTAVALILYLLAWGAAVLWELLAWAAGYFRDMLAPTAPEARFPDLDEAWAGVTAALDGQGIPLSTTPLYLVLGEMPAGYDPFFRAIPHGLAVTGGNPSDSLLQVFANRDGVFLTVPGASLLGAHTSSLIIELTYGMTKGESQDVMGSIGLGGSLRLSRSVGLGSMMMPAAGLAGGGGSIAGSYAGSYAGSIGGSFAAAPQMAEIQQIIQRVRQEGRPLTDAEREQMRRLSGAAGNGRVAAPPPRSHGGESQPVNVLKNPALLAEAEDRITHLCDLIAAARSPAAPLNGVLLAVPSSALDDAATAEQWGEIARHDLIRFEESLGVRVPVYVVVGGLENLPGGVTFFEKFGAGKTGRRLGKGFPLSPAVPADQTSAGVDRTARWVLGDLLPFSALNLTRVTGNLPADTAENAGLFRFLDATRLRGKHLSQLLVRGVTLPDRVPGFAGCYVTVVLPSNPNEAAFARDLFVKMLGSVNNVAWTPAAFDRDGGYKRAAMLVNVTAVAVAVLTVVLAVYVGMRQLGGK
jgi:hypothetical protein